jgi:protein SCO1/2
MSAIVMAAGRVSAAAQRRVAGIVGRPLFWAAFVGLLAGLPMLRTIMTELPPPLPVLATIPDFELRDEHGQPYGSAQLRGRVWVANFIFTRCPTICPAFTAKMGQIQHRSRGLGQAFRLVSFTADPDYDTPEVLAAFARKHRASPRMWSFLTGPFDAVRKTVVDGMKVGMGRGGPESDFASIFHGTHFVLVDKDMQIRGYYDSSAADSVDRVLRDAGLLANRGE